MTRDEAIEKIRNLAPAVAAEQLTDALHGLGLLTFDQPPTRQKYETHVKAWHAIWPTQDTHVYAYISPSHLLEALARVGLKIVEKD